MRIHKVKIFEQEMNLLKNYDLIESIRISAVDSFAADYDANYNINNYIYNKTKSILRFRISMHVKFRV